MKSYRICNRCLMDTSDPDIVFYSNGYCNHCNNALDSMETIWKRNDADALPLLFSKIKKENQDKQYDCIIGISGGIDSSYLAYLGHKYGIRMLGVHIDAGWNTDISEKNIKKLTQAYNIDLETIKIDMDEMMDLQKSYYLSEVPNQDVPQDHAFFSSLYKYAIEKNIRYVLNGINFSTECIHAMYFSFDAKDATNLLDIHRQFGSRPLASYPIMDYKTFYKDIPNHESLAVVTPLNLIDYKKDEAIKTLQEDSGFEYYGGKHLESRFTKLHQNYILVNKFKHDKRRAHLSSLIVTGQITREEALEELKKPLYDTAELESDIAFFINKIGISREKFNEVISKPGKSHYDYAVNKTSRMMRTRRNITVKHPRLKKIVKRILKK